MDVEWKFIINHYMDSLYTDLRDLCLCLDLELELELEYEEDLLLKFSFWIFMERLFILVQKKQE